MHARANGRFSACILWLSLVLAPFVLCAGEPRLEVLQFDSQVLKSNPLHDPGVRRVAVFLPAQATNGARLPVVYYLPGYGGNADNYIHGSNVWLKFTQKIADQISEVDRKRKDDSDMIAKQIEGLAHAAAITPTPVTHSSSHQSTSSTGDVSGPDVSAVPQNGYYYEIKPGDTLSLVVKAYRDKGVKVSSRLVLKANPGLDPNKLYVGKKIFIPDPAAKSTTP